MIDWMLVVTIAAPILALLVGAGLDRTLERKPKLVAYFSHASVFTLRPEGQPPQTIHTHAIVIRNAGRKPATNVRVSHVFLPDNFTVFPDTPYDIQNLPEGGAEIVFPALVPGEQITISYLYFPPLLFNQIHSGIRHDEGLARELTVLPTPQVAPWIRRSLFALIALGGITLLYLVVVAARELITLAR